MIRESALTTLAGLLLVGDSTIRVERLDLWGELEFYGDASRSFHESWDPQPRPGETLLFRGIGEEGLPIAVFVSRN